MSEVLLSYKKTTVELDSEKLRRASAVLSTKTVKATIDSALDQVIEDERLKQLIESSRTHRGIDPDLLLPEAREKAWHS